MIIFDSHTTITFRSLLDQLVKFNSKSKQPYLQSEARLGIGIMHTITYYEIILLWKRAAFNLRDFNLWKKLKCWIVISVNCFKVNYSVEFSRNLTQPYLRFNLPIPKLWDLHSIMCLQKAFEKLLGAQKLHFLFLSQKSVNF